MSLTNCCLILIPKQLTCRIHASIVPPQVENLLVLEGRNQEQIVTIEAQHGFFVSLRGKKKCHYIRLNMLKVSSLWKRTQLWYFTTAMYVFLDTTDFVSQRHFQETQIRCLWLLDLHACCPILLISCGTGLWKKYWNLRETKWNDLLNFFVWSVYKTMLQPSKESKYDDPL